MAVHNTVVSTLEWKMKKCDCWNLKACSKILSQSSDGTSRSCSSISGRRRRSDSVEAFIVISRHLSVIPLAILDRHEVEPSTLLPRDEPPPFAKRDARRIVARRAQFWTHLHGEEQVGRDRMLRFVRVLLLSFSPLLRCLRHPARVCVLDRCLNSGSNLCQRGVIESAASADGVNHVFFPSPHGCLGVADMEGLPFDIADVNFCWHFPRIDHEQK